MRILLESGRDLRFRSTRYRATASMPWQSQFTELDLENQNERTRLTRGVQNAGAAATGQELVPDARPLFCPSLAAGTAIDKTNRPAFNKWNKTVHNGKRELFAWLCYCIQHIFNLTSTSRTIQGSLMLVAVNLVLSLYTFVFNR